MEPVEEVTADFARQHWSMLLDRALRGEETVVLRHGRPVAVIVPYDPVPVNRGGGDD